MEHDLAGRILRIGPHGVDPNGCLVGAIADLENGADQICSRDHSTVGPLAAERCPDDFELGDGSPVVGTRRIGRYQRRRQNRRAKPAARVSKGSQLR